MLSRHAESVARRHGDPGQNLARKHDILRAGKSGVSVPQYGNGVMFTSVDANQQAVLQKWLEEVSRSAGLRELPNRPGREINEQIVARLGPAFVLNNFPG